MATMELHLEANDKVQFEPHNENVFLLELGDDLCIWVAWPALLYLKRAVDDACTEDKLRSQRATDLD